MKKWIASTLSLWIALGAMGAHAASATMPFDEWVKTKPTLEDPGSLIDKNICRLSDGLPEKGLKSLYRRLESTMKRILPTGDLSTALATPACFSSTKGRDLYSPWIHLDGIYPVDRLKILQTLEANYAEKGAQANTFKALLAAKDSRGQTALDVVELERRGKLFTQDDMPGVNAYVEYLCKNGVRYSRLPNQCGSSDYTATIAALERRVKSGDAKAMLELADMYLEGLGVAKNPHRVISLYKDAATAGDALARQKLESAYSQGIDGEGQNWPALADMAKRSGDWLRLGWMYETGGPAFAKDQRAALDAYRRAADAGDLTGYVMVTRVATDLKEWPTVKRYAEKGIELTGTGDDDYAELMMRLAALYMDGSGVQRDESRFIAIRYAFSACDCPRKVLIAMKFTHRPELAIIQRFAERGDERAAFLMGEQYIWGRFGSKDYTGAAPWYMQAARAGEPFSQEMVGKMYNTGTGLEKNPQLAKEWFAKAAKQGQKGAQYTLDHWKD